MQSSRASAILPVTLYLDLIEILRSNPFSHHTKIMVKHCSIIFVNRACNFGARLSVRYTVAWCTRIISSRLDHTIRHCFGTFSIMTRFYEKRYWLLNNDFRATHDLSAYDAGHTATIVYIACWRLKRVYW